MCFLRILPAACLQPKAHPHCIATAAARAHSNTFLPTKLQKIVIISLNSGTFPRRKALPGLGLPCWTLTCSPRGSLGSPGPPQTAVQPPGSVERGRQRMRRTAGLPLPQVHKEMVCLLSCFMNRRAFLGNPNGFMGLKVYSCGGGDDQERPGRERSPGRGRWGRPVCSFISL